MAPLVAVLPALTTGTAATAATAGSVGLMEAAALAIPGVSATAGLSTAGAAATAGLFGAGGTFGLAQTMGTLGLLGSGLSAMGSIAEADTQKQIMEQNAQVADQEARLASEKGKFDSLQMSRERRKAIGAQVAAFGGSGVDMVGSPLDVIADTYANYERDLQMTGYNTDVAVRSKKSEADIYRWGAGRAMTAGYMKAGSTILGGVGKSLLGKKGIYA